MEEMENLGKKSVFTISTLVLLLLSAGILVLLLFGSGFALLFDRKDIFFGLSLDRGAAGIVLLIKVVLSVILLAILIDYPRHFHWFVTLSLVFSGLLLSDSIVTSLTTVTGFWFFSPVPGFYFLFSTGLFIIHQLEPARDMAAN